MKYPNFAFRFWLNEDLYNGFDSSIKSSMKDISTAYVEYNYSSGGIYYNGVIKYINEKIKCPSITELGMTDSNRPSKYVKEGTQYPLFTSSKQGTINQPYYISNSLLKNSNGSQAIYWSRSMIPSYSENHVGCPAMIVPRTKITDGAYVYYGSENYTDNYDSLSTYSIGHNATTVHYRMNGEYEYVPIGIRGIIRFSKQ